MRLHPGVASEHAHCCRAVPSHTLLSCCWHLQGIAAVDEVVALGQRLTRHVPRLKLPVWLVGKRLPVLLNDLATFTRESGVEEVRHRWNRCDAACSSSHPGASSTAGPAA